MKAISGKSPVTGETVNGGVLEKDYDIVKNELMQILHSHKLTAGQAVYALELCKKSINTSMYAIVDF